MKSPRPPIPGSYCCQAGHVVTRCASGAEEHNGLMPSTNEAELSWTSSGLDFLLCLDRNARGFGAVLQQAVRDAIRSGRLRRGDPLPSTRTLASDLGVARGTVVEAYEQLIAEGWLVARQGAATKVADLPPAPSAPVEPPTLPAPRHDLRPGHADPSSFPRQAWATAMRRVLAEAPDEAFGYADPRGRAELRGGAGRLPRAGQGGARHSRDRAGVRRRRARPGHRVPGRCRPRCPHRRGRGSQLAADARDRRRGWSHRAGAPLRRSRRASGCASRTRRWSSATGPRPGEAIARQSPPSAISSIPSTRPADRSAARTCLFRL